MNINVENISTRTLFYDTTYIFDYSLFFSKIQCCINVLLIIDKKFLKNYQNCQLKLRKYLVIIESSQKLK